MGPKAKKPQTDSHGKSPPNMVPVIVSQELYLSASDPINARWIH